MNSSVPPPPEDIVSASEWASPLLARMLATPPSPDILARAQHAAALGLGWSSGPSGVLSWDDPASHEKVRATLEALVAAAGTANLLDGNGHTPMLAAALDFHPLLVLAWAHAGADMDARAADGGTVLHALVSDKARLESRSKGLDLWGKHWLQTAVALVKSGVDPAARDFSGNSVVDCMLRRHAWGDEDLREFVEGRLATAHAAFLEKTTPLARASRAPPRL